jgi:hypothetical protein
MKIRWAGRADAEDTIAPDNVVQNRHWNEKRNCAGDAGKKRMTNLLPLPTGRRGDSIS